MPFKWNWLIIFWQKSTNAPVVHVSTVEIVAILSEVSIVRASLVTRESCVKRVWLSPSPSHTFSFYFRLGACMRICLSRSPHKRTHIPVHIFTHEHAHVLSNALTNTYALSLSGPYLKALRKPKANFQLDSERHIINLRKFFAKYMDKFVVTEFASCRCLVELNLSIVFFSIGSKGINYETGNFYISKHANVGINYIFDPI